MKIRIELEEGLREDEVIIRCQKVDESILKLQQSIRQSAMEQTTLTLYKDKNAYFVPLEKILFFETGEERVYAHTREDAFFCKYRLYALESLLPNYFARAAKSTIVNIKQIYSITHNLTAASLIRFQNSHKQVYVSRYYYQQLRERLRERSSYET